MGLAPLRQELRHLCQSMASRMETLESQVGRFESAFGRRIDALEQRVGGSPEVQCGFRDGPLDAVATPNFARVKEAVFGGKDLENGDMSYSDGVYTGDTSANWRPSGVDSIGSDLDATYSDNHSPEAVCRQSSARIVDSAGPVQGGPTGPAAADRLPVEGNGGPGRGQGRTIAPELGNGNVEPSRLPAPAGYRGNPRGNGGARPGLSTGPGVVNQRRRSPGAGTARPALRGKSGGTSWS